MHKFLFYVISFIAISCQQQNKATVPVFAENRAIAHRGAWKTQNLPENSIAALKHAIALNCTGSEFDVRMTADSTLIVTHDNTYAGLNIEENTYSELAKQKLKNGESLPLLKDFIKAGMTQNDSTALICEIKPSSIAGKNELLAHKVVELVAELNAEDYIGYYISFSYDILKTIKKLRPEAKVQYLDGSKSPEALAEDGIEGMDYYIDVFRKKPEWIASAKAKNIRLNAWTVNEAEDIEWLINNDFDYITTNEPELVLELDN
ncbi:glycerophosphodiester phosphodiesterase family protein [Leeuwenhoekiella aequorea]|uniref:glycerophosphodiester phosphodiesterase n=1 Tax=Leeuwenhoekiella aequorea TaxID=283736 RepID=UPI00352BDF93|tara:strand:+ start:8364 stop:9149 length:786 start_codon:yes stop_codon:yes gene_type:complete